MKVTYEERPLEELENEIVEYIINTPQNTNPNVARTMVRAAGEKVSAGGSKPVYFRIEGDSYDNAQLFNVATNEKPSHEELIFSLLKSNVIFLKPCASSNQQEGLVIGNRRYDLLAKTGFSISSADQLYVTGNGLYLRIFGDGIGTQAREIAADYFANL